MAFARSNIALLPDTDVAPSGRRGTLLVVDDEEGPRDSLRVIFKEEFNVLLAPDGATAVELAQKHPIDVAILDIRMSGMSGIEVLERLKFVDPAIEVLIMTAFETPDTMRQALRLRACDYINKPFDISTMRLAVAAAMHRRTLDSEISNNNRQLEQLRAELQDQKVKEQMSNARGEIYASIIHDINGPLTVISGFIQLLNQRLGDANSLTEGDVHFVKERLKTITRQVTNCIEISRRYLSLMRNPPGEVPRVSFNQLLVDLGHLIRVHPALQNNDFTIRPLPKDVDVRINGTDLLQILLNLVVNGLQCAQQPHAVSVLATLHDQPLELDSLRDGPQDRVLNLDNFDNASPLIAISVSDTGPGIPAETLPKVFQPYFTTKAARHGTGLGLSIVQRLTREARGLLHVRTEVGQGTTFALYLSVVPRSE